MGPSAGNPAAAKPAEPPDTRPIVRLKVLNAFKPEDKIFPQVVEGRLISDLADMETFRTVASDKRGDYLLTATIRSVALNQYDTYKQSRDAESDGAPTTQNEMNVTMLLELSLENREGKEVYTGKLSSEAVREVDVSTEQTVNLATQELIDRAAQRLEKLLRKKLKKLGKS